MFNLGKNILESAIAFDVNNLQLKYLRLTKQMNAPKIIVYTGDIDSDKEYLAKNINEVKDLGPESIINNYLYSIKK